MQQRFADGISEVIKNLTQKHQEELIRQSDERSVLQTEMQLLEEQKAALQVSLAAEKNSSQEQINS